MQVRKATAEQAQERRRDHASGRYDAARRGDSTARAIAEQAWRADQILKVGGGTDEVRAVHVSRAMSEQTAAATQISHDVVNMRQQTDQAAKAVAEQSRAVQDIARSSSNTLKQIKLITPPPVSRHPPQPI